MERRFFSRIKGVIPKHSHNNKMMFARSSSVCCRLRLRAATSSVASRFGSTLVVSEPLLDDAVVPQATQACVTAARQLDASNDLSLLVVGPTLPTQVPEGITNIYHAPTAQNNAVSETVASAIQETIQNDGDWEFVVGASSKFGSTVMPRAAALLQVSPVTDVTEIVEKGTSIACILAWFAWNMYRLLLVDSMLTRFVDVISFSVVSIYR